MNFSEINHKTILFAALDWGLGHVTRSIGIIRELLEQENKIVIACTEEQKLLFQSYFPELEYVFLEGYNFKFSGKGNWALDLWKQRKSFFKSIRIEQEFVELYCTKNKIDLVISDHRYGFFSKFTSSVFVTHQLHLPIPKLYFFIQKWHEKQLLKFDSLWVLDKEECPLAGKLSKRIQHPNLTYLGWKSRFIGNQFHEIQYDYLIVVSGPKPYSEQFIDEVKTKIDFSRKRVAVLFPKNIKINKENPNWKYYPASDLMNNDELFFESETIISRSGYSTLMDLKILNKKAILYPTKGQKEQEYLAKINQF
ncbi:MAG: hypothetical protein ACK5B9_00970 [Flavobacteriia bacterium]|jgi:UDP:flavonoid glycosyltransferase YjiC (YdhE family)